jgi:hypothetical protein
MLDVYDLVAAAKVQRRTAMSIHLEVGISSLIYKKDKITRHGRYARR